MINLRPIAFSTLILALVLTLAAPLAGYSVLTHEEIIDLVWSTDIQPLLLQRFPQSTPEELRKAHAYAYGGAVIQDMGYYPFGSAFFSDLLHYVRSGDFVQQMLQDAADVNEYAFALGALAHYASDLTGHPAVNESVAIEYPKLRARYGNRVTYAQGKVEHLQTEFGFDVVQVAKGRYAPQAYHDFIGFEVSKPLLERAFRETYGIKLSDVLPVEDLAIGTYRRSVSKIIPKMTKVALATRHDQIVREYPDKAKQKFLYTLSRATYEKDWGRDYTRPGAGSRFLAFVLNLVPQVGPLRGVRYRDPTPKTEDLYFKSITATVEYYRTLLRELRAGVDPELPNRDFDTGKPTAPGEYRLTDDTYAKLVDKLSKDDFATVTPDLRANILQFYGDLSANLSTKRNRCGWLRLTKQVTQLRNEQPHVQETSAK